MLRVGATRPISPRHAQRVYGRRADVQLAANVGPQLKLVWLVDKPVCEGAERLTRRSQRIAPRQTESAW